MLLIDCEKNTSRLKEFKDIADAMTNIIGDLIDVQNVPNKDWNDFRDSMQQISTDVSQFQLLLDCEYINEEYNKIAGNF